MKKILLFNLLLAMLFGATNAWAADDDLYCCGQKQSSQYNWNYTTTNNINGAITSGSISYNAASKTVTFDNTYATVTGDNRIFYNKNVEGLKIVFKGYCRLRSDKCVFRLDKDTEILGSTDLVQLQGMGDNAQCIYCPNETVLTITDAMKMSMISKYWRAIETNGTNVNITNSRIYAQGADCAIQNDKGSDFKGYLGMSGCFIRDIWTESYGSVGADPYIFNGYHNGEYYYNFLRVHTAPAKSVMIILDEDYIGVRLKGIALTKGWSLNEEPSNPAYGIEDCYTYDESTNTLTLKKDIQAPGEYDEELEDRDWAKDYIGISVNSPFTIDGGGHSVYGEIGMRCSSDVSLSNIILAGNKNIGIDKKSGTLTLKDNVIIGGIENAINGYGTVKFNPSALETVTLVPCNDKFRETSTFTDKPVRGCSIRLEDCSVTTPRYGEIGTSGFEVDGNTVFSKVVVTGTVKYDLWVGETQVTSVNSPDILGDGGHFKYNALTKTLTVNNATLSNRDQKGRGIVNKINGLTVNFVGENTFTTYDPAILSEKSITLTGTGSLTATSNVSPLYFAGNYDDITCTIDGLQVDLTGRKYVLRGYQCNATLNVTGSSTRLALHPVDGYQAIYNLNALNIGSGLSISQPYGGYFDPNRGCIIVDGMSYIGDVVIDNATIFELDAEGSNSSTIASANGQTTNVVIHNMEIGSQWRFICLPFDLPLAGSSLQNCDVRALESIDVQSGGVVVLNFMTPIAEMKANTPYLIMNRGSSNIVDPVFYDVKIVNPSSDGTTYSHNITFGINYVYDDGSYDGIYILKEGLMLSEEKNGVVNYAFEGWVRDNGLQYKRFLVNPGDNNEMLELDAKGYNVDAIASANGQTVNVTIKNMEIWYQWRFICLPFDLKLAGSMFENCDVRALESIDVRNGCIAVLNFLTPLTEMKANKPYIIKSRGYRVANPVFVNVKIVDSSYTGISYPDGINFYPNYNYDTESYSSAYLLKGSVVLTAQIDGEVNEAFESWVSDYYSQYLYIVVNCDDRDIDAIITGVDNINANLNPNEGIFNLAGQRLSKMQKGINIKGGKKYLQM